MNLIANALEMTDRATNELEAIFGSVYFKDSIEKYKEKDPSGAGMGRHHDSRGAPPLAYLWYRAREEIIFGTLDAIFSPGTASARIMALYKDLELAGPLALSSQLLDYLKSQDYFELAAFALSVATGYKEMGYEIEDLCLEKNNRISSMVAKMGNITTCLLCQENEQNKNDSNLSSHSLNIEQIKILLQGQIVPLLEQSARLKIKADAPRVVYLNLDFQINLSRQDISELCRETLLYFLQHAGDALAAVVLSIPQLQAGSSGTLFVRQGLAVVNPSGLPAALKLYNFTASPYIHI